MVNSVNFAITIFNYLDDARLVQGATFPCGQRILCIKAISATEDPSGFFSRKHKPANINIYGFNPVERLIPPKDILSASMCLFSISVLFLVMT